MTNNPIMHKPFGTNWIMRIKSTTKNHVKNRNKTKGVLTTKNT